MAFVPRPKASAEPERGKGELASCGSCHTFPAGFLWGLDYYLIWKTNSPVNEESSLPLEGTLAS